MGGSRPPCPSISRAHDGSDPAMSHDHSHGHSHTPASFDRAFAIGIALNLGFVAIEAGYGFVADSVALLADAGHNLRSEEHTSELQSLMRTSYSVFCLKKKKN